MATQIKVANEAKQDTMIANNVEIFEGLDNYGTIKSVQRGEILEITDQIVGDKPAGSEIKIISLNPTDINRCKLIANYRFLELRTNPIYTTKQYSYPSLVLKADGIYTAPSAKLFDRFSIRGLSWQVIEYF